MQVRSSLTRAIPLVVLCVVLVAAVVLRFGLHRRTLITPRVDTPPRVVSQPPKQPTETPAAIEPSEGRLKTSKPEVHSPAAPAPKTARSSPAAPSAGRVREGRAEDRRDVGVAAPPTLPAPPPTLPAPPPTAAVSPPTLPEPPAGVGKVAEAIEPMAPLPKAVTVPEVREIAPRDRVYQKESTALARVLGHYEQAYDRLDAPGAAAVWPSVDSRALARAFARLQSQDLDFGNCTFAVSVSDAAARCAGILRYARRIGDTTLKTERHVWTIEFARAGESWQIVRITAQ
jgi:hypothetical protein